ncbi:MULTISPECIES: glycosyltransferase family 4 protein [Grimontia]|nr:MULTISPECIES: glycosyltransferase family 4 protein [Grimontia]
MELDALKQTNLFLSYGVDAVLICRKNTFLEQIAKEQDIPLISIDFKAKLSIPLIFGLRKAIKEIDINTLIFFGASEIKSIYFSVMGTNCRVIVRHGTTKSSSKKDPIHRIFYSCVSDYVGISEHLSRNILDILPASEGQVHTIYNSLDTNDIGFNRNSSLTFLHIGRVENGKGVIDAIKALSKAKIPIQSKVITYVGSIEEKSVQKEIERLALEGGVNVVFEGFCKNVSSFYSDNSFFLFPSYGEGLPNVMLEAISKGLSCITYDNTVFSEFIKLGFDGVYLAEDRNIDDLSKMIEIAYQERKGVNLEANMTRFNDVFSINGNIKKWLELIDG